MAQLYYPFSTSLVTEWPGQRTGSYHWGTDFAVAVGTLVRATSSGTIVFVGDDGLGGMTIDLRRDDGLIQRFGHLSKYLVSVGQRVEAGQGIALSGNTGNSLGPHLHWELRWDRLWNGGKWVDPRTLSPASFDSTSTSATTTNSTPTDEDDEDMLTMYGNKADGMVIACSMATGYWWHIPNMDYLNLMKARGLVKNQDPIYLESNEFGFLKQLLGWASDSLNRGGGTATIDLGAIKTTVTESLSALNVNVDALATAIAAKINAGVAIDDVTTKAEILAAIEANYPEEKK